MPDKKKQCLAAKCQAGASHDVADATVPTPERSVVLLQRGPHHVVALKPPAVLCHHSGWAGSRSLARTRRGEAPHVPMLQRVRDAIHDIDRQGRRDVAPREEVPARRGGPPPSPMRKLNLVHRLDRGASGALLLTYAKDGNDGVDGGSGEDSESESDGNGKRETGAGHTRQLIEAMRSPNSVKTYVALVRGPWSTSLFVPLSLLVSVRFYSGVIPLLLRRRRPARRRSQGPGLVCVLASDERRQQGERGERRDDALALRGGPGRDGTNATPRQPGAGAAEGGPLASDPTAPELPEPSHSGGQHARPF